MSARMPLLTVSTGMAAGALALGYALGGFWAGMVWILALGFLWLIGQWRQWRWMASIGLVFFVGAAAGGFWLGLAAGWMLLGVVAALDAWDLDYFFQRLSRVAADETLAQRRELKQRHLRRLAVVNVMGLLLAAVALEVRFEFSFGAAFWLGLLAILGLSQAVGFLRRESD